MKKFMAFLVLCMVLTGMFCFTMAEQAVVEDPEVFDSHMLWVDALSIGEDTGLRGGNDHCLTALVKYDGSYYRLTLLYEDELEVFADIIAHPSEAMSEEYLTGLRSAMEEVIAASYLSKYEKIPVSDVLSDSGLIELEGCLLEELADYNFQWTDFETAGLSDEDNPVLHVTSGIFIYNVILDVTVDEFETAFAEGVEAVGKLPVKTIENDGIVEWILDPMYNPDGTLRGAENEG